MDSERLQAVARRHRLTLVVRHGSSVTGRLRPDSDLDLAVLVDGGCGSFSAFADLAADLQALVPDREVDVAVLNHADPLFLKKVTDACELVYGSAARLAALKLHAFHRYQDYRPYLAMEAAYVERKLAARRR